MKFLNERGYALFLTIAVITLISVLALGLIKVTANSQKITVDERDDQSLFYIAESGVNLEKAKITKILNKLHGEAIYELNVSRTQKEFQDFIAPYGDVKGFYKSYIEGNFCSAYSGIVDLNNCAKNGTITISNQYNHYNTQFNKQPITATKTSGNCIDDVTNVSCLFTILSTAIYDGEPTNSRSLKQTIKIDFNTAPTVNSTVTLVDTISGVSLEKLAALITGNITVNGGGKGSNYINGNIANPSTGHKFNYAEGSGSIELEKDINISLLLPQKPSAPETIKTVQTLESSPLTTDMKLKGKIEKNTTIYVGNNDINLFVEDIDLDGVKIIGNGKVNIIITNGTNSDINGKFNQNGNALQTTIFYEGSFPKINSESVINASLYTNSLPGFTGKGSLDIKGNIYHPSSGSLTLSGNSSLKANSWIAPLAKIELKGGGNNVNFTGTIIAKDLLVGGNIDLVAGSNLKIPIPSTSSKYGGNNDTVKESSLTEI